jgi:hypothetical protein
LGRKTNSLDIIKFLWQTIWQCIVNEKSHYHEKKNSIFERWIKHLLKKIFFPETETETNKVCVTGVFNCCDRRYVKKKSSWAIVQFVSRNYSFFDDNVFFRLLGTLKTSVTETLLYQENFFLLSPRTIKAVILQVILVYHRNKLFKSKNQLNNIVWSSFFFPIYSIDKFWNLFFRFFKRVYLVSLTVRKHEWSINNKHVQSSWENILFYNYWCVLETKIRGVDTGKSRCRKIRIFRKNPEIPVYSVDILNNPKIP